MTVAERLTRRIEQLEAQIAEMEANNDGSLAWVDDVRQLHTELWDVELELAEFGGYNAAWHVYP